jgi:hypothetical protein
LDRAPMEVEASEKKDDALSPIAVED